MGSCLLSLFLFFVCIENSDAEFRPEGLNGIVKIVHIVLRQINAGSSCTDRRRKVVLSPRLREISSKNGWEFCRFCVVYGGRIDEIESLTRRFFDSHGQLATGNGSQRKNARPRAPS